MNFLKKLDKHAEEYIMGALLVGIACVMIVQVVMRMFKSSIPWAEELCRYFYVWSVFLSIACTIRNGNILKITLLLDMIKLKGVKKAIRLVLELIGMVFYGALAYWSIDVVKTIQASGQTSPAMVAPTWIIYLIVPIGFGLAALRSAQQIFYILRNKETEKVPDEVQEALESVGGEKL